MRIVADIGSKGQRANQELYVAGYLAMPSIRLTKAFSEKQFPNNDSFRRKRFRR